MNFSKEEVDDLIKKFGINTAVKPIDVDLGRDTAAFEFSKKEYLLYLIDSPEIKKIACYPSIVGEELEKLTLKAAHKAYDFMKRMALLNNNIIFQHILRASLGYNLHKVLREKAKISETWVRTRYVEPSYQDHDNSEKKLEIIYENFRELEALSGKRADVIVQDTVASGKTAETSLQYLIEMADKNCVKLERVIFYGLLAEKGLELIWNNVLKKRGIQLIAIAMGNITPLSCNGYDMPLYGPDEEFYTRHHILKKLGGIVARSTLEEWLPESIPGVDQAGDYSARLLMPFNGMQYEKTEISTHLKHSKENILKIETLLKKELPHLYDKISPRIYEELNEIDRVNKEYEK